MRVSKGFLKAVAAVLVVYISIAAFLMFQPMKKQEFEQGLKFRALQVVTDIGRGSAIYLDKGLALSAAHVCELFPKAKQVFLVDGHGTKMFIQFYEMPAMNKGNRIDLCIIKFKPINKLPVTHLSEETSIPTGTPLYNPNYGGGKFYSLHIGHVLGSMGGEIGTDCTFLFCEDYLTYFFQQTSVPGVPGASGSGVLDTDGKLVGILVLGAGDNSWSGIVPLEVVREFLNDSGLAGLASINKK